MKTKFSLIEVLKDEPGDVESLLQDYDIRTVREQTWFIQAPSWLDKLKAQFALYLLDSLKCNGYLMTKHEDPTAERLRTSMAAPICDQSTEPLDADALFAAFAKLSSLKD